MFAVNPIAVVLLVIVVIVVAVVIWFIVTYNGFVKLRNTVEEAFSTMDVYLKKRFDLIPNLVETVKGYAAHESGTLEKVVRARSAISGAATPAEKIEGENLLGGALKSVFALAESYPALRANENFLALQSQLGSIENDIANARKYYNGTVRLFNTKTETFPSALLAALFNFKRMPMFEAADDAERENVRVQF
ncbi:MAG: LemA family protein [Clostridiales Family XIII bacterium]|jgi:LemA protein|nr:LemA family protein [Clostridiales Family XIII bacterium]